VLLSPIVNLERITILHFGGVVMRTRDGPLGDWSEHSTRESALSGAWSASEQSWNDLNLFKDCYLKAKARIWP